MLNLLGIIRGRKTLSTPNLKILKLLSTLGLPYANHILELIEAVTDSTMSITTLNTWMELI